ncbi:MAG: FAD-dependent oxidoreductase [Pseudomonadota bacterium]
MSIKADICVIGGGSGGLSVAAGAAQMGQKVVLIEKGEMGGDCLNTGCVPSKALLSAAKHAHAFGHSEDFGIAPAAPQIDFAKTMAHVRGVIDAIAPIDSQERFEGLGVKVIRAHGRFTGPRTVEAGGETVEARYIVLATGSTAAIPPIPGLDEVPYLTNETLFQNTQRPDHLIVIGGGPIGLEMAQAHARLGAKVTVLEAFKALSKDDPELATIVLDAVRADGVNIREGASVLSVSEAADGGVEVTIQDKGETRLIAGSHLLVATGRKPTVDGLDLDAAGVAYSPRGVTVDNRLRTTNKRVYAAGDVIGGRQFTHVAGYHAGIIVRNALFKVPAKNQDHLAPWATYTDPELAHVGITEAEAKEQHGDKVTVLRWEGHENDRAQAERRTESLIKVSVDKKGRPLGASIVAPHAGDLIQPWAMAMTSGLKMSDFTGHIAAYPTYSELSKRIGGAWYTPTLFSGKTRLLLKALSVFG